MNYKDIININYKSNINVYVTLNKYSNENN